MNKESTKQSPSIQRSWNPTSLLKNKLRDYNLEDGFGSNTVNSEFHADQHYQNLNSFNSTEPLIGSMAGCKDQIAILLTVSQEDHLSKDQKTGNRWYAIRTAWDPCRRHVKSGQRIRAYQKPENRQEKGYEK